MAVILNYPLFHADNDAGAPLTGGLLYTYIAGSSTAKATYTDRGAGTANSNPVVLDSRGESIIYGSGIYKLPECAEKAGGNIGRQVAIPEGIKGSCQALSAVSVMAVSAGIRKIGVGGNISR